MINCFVFLLYPGCAHALRAGARGCGAWVEFPCNGPRCIGVHNRPAPRCPVGSHPTGLGLLAPPPLRPPASGYGEPTARGLQFPQPPVGGPLSSNPEGPIRGGTAGPHLPWWLTTGQESLPQPRRAWGDERAANPPVFLGRHKGTQRHRCRCLHLRC